MKSLFWGVLLLLPPALFAQTVHYGAASNLPLFLKYPTVPQFSIIRPDGSYFTKANLKKNTPVLFMDFSVDCEHCQHETEEIIKNIKKFKGTQIVMVTPFRVDEMATFYHNYHISRYPEIIMGSDPNRWITSTFFFLHYFPGLYVYNKRDQLVYHFEGTRPVDTLIHYLKKR
ncbi:MAG: TlpA family protein disulfide reductase [Chitinophagaceae bacterium]